MESPCITHALGIKVSQKTAYTWLVLLIYLSTLSGNCISKWTQYNDMEGFENSPQFHKYIAAAMH